MASDSNKSSADFNKGISTWWKKRENQMVIICIYVLNLIVLSEFWSKKGVLHYIESVKNQKKWHVSINNCKGYVWQDGKLYNCI